jgi:hypothetical protein
MNPDRPRELALREALCSDSENAAAELAGVYDHSLAHPPGIGTRSEQPYAGVRSLLY